MSGEADNMRIRRRRENRKKKRKQAEAKKRSSRRQAVDQPRLGSHTSGDAWQN
jgi:hypothetical protein